MPMDLMGSMDIASSGLNAQGTRLRVISQNLANANSTATQPGGEPYRRKTIFFKEALDRELGIETVAVDHEGTDSSDFVPKYDPSHPAADANGYILTPNVNPMVEMMDMREARMAYEANLNVIETSKSLLSQTIGMLRN